MCDGNKCFRAYHVGCLGIKDHMDWDEDEDWQCVWCESRGELLEIVNDYFPLSGMREGTFSPRSPRTPTTPGGSRRR